MGSLWIGPPGQLREIGDAATDYDRTVDLGVTEFQALGGGITTTSRTSPPRRITLAWTGLTDGDVRWLDALARRAFGPRSLGLVEPVAVNLLDAPQSGGFGPLSGYQLAGSGTLAVTADRMVTVTGTSSGSALRWRHPTWTGWPVPPGVRVGFYSTLAPISGVCMLDYFNATGTQLGSSPQGAAVYELPPTGTVFVRPAVLLFPSTTPVPVGSAWLSFGSPAEPGQPMPVGDGCPAMTVTSYSDKPRLWGRDITVSLVEVRRAGG